MFGQAAPKLPSATTSPAWRGGAGSWGPFFLSAPLRLMKTASRGPSRRKPARSRWREDDPWGRRTGWGVAEGAAKWAPSARPGGGSAGTGWSINPHSQACQARARRCRAVGEPEVRHFPAPTVSPKDGLLPSLAAVLKQGCLCLVSWV